MKRLLTLLALVLCSCAETFVGEEIARPNNENLPDLTASFADEDATRTYVENNKYLRWHEDDRLTAFYGNTLNRQYKFNGKTGDNSGTFSLVPSGELGTGNAFDHIYALYPYNADARITDEGVISLTLPAVQNYAENSFGRGANTMIAVTENLEDTFLAFKNACGYLKLKLYNAEGATIKSIEVKGNNGERLAGAATATIAFGEAPVLAMAEDATTSVTLNCGEGVALGTTAETATEFWIVLPATTFAEGLTFTATDTEGGVFEKSTTNEVIIERNAIQPMAVLEAKFVATKPANNEIWYTATAKVTPYSSNVFGANIVSNTYDATKKCWVIKFDGDITTIGRNAFYNCSNLTSITIPNSVTMIEDYALALCIKLTSINIPDSVTTIGKAAFNRCDTLTSIIIPNSVTTIERDAFCGCYSLTSITIPDSVTTIQSHTFYYCESLTSVTIPNSVTAIELCAFENCESLTNITLPDSITSIGERAFCSCDILTSITISNSLTTIGEQAFSYCSSLTSITIPDSVTSIGNSAFYNCSSLTSITIPNGVTSIGNSAFGSCDSLTSVTIPNGVTTIGENAFNNCKSLTSVTIPDSVTMIGEDAFAFCDSLTSVTIPDSVTSIGKRAFNWCSSLTSVTIGDSVTTIEERVFDLCDRLNSVYCKATTPPSLGGYAFSTFAYNLKIYVPKESIEVYKKASGWGTYASKIIGYNFKPETDEIWYTNGSTTEATTPNRTNVFGANIVSNTYDTAKECWVIKFDSEITTIGDYAFQYCSSLTSVTIGDSVTTIGDYAFYGCSSLTSVTIPDSVTTIGWYAFSWCESLTSVTIPDSVTTIGSYAFERCSSLTSVTIPDSVTEIGNSAFSGCCSLTSVYCKATTPPVALLNDGYWFAFYDNASDLKIYVPMESVEAYKNADGWSDYASDIVGYDVGAYYTVTLNNAWRQSTSVSNPDSSLYDGVYESYSNYNVNNGVATMYIDIDGYSEFSIYVRSNAESTYDYVTVSELDSTTQKMSTSGKQNSGTAISNYTKVTYTGIDGGKHRITVIYKKDSSQHSGTDRGYLIIPKNQ